jgi:ribonuclease T2
VGVVGYYFGGGHGPFAPSKGLGVDQVLEAEIVTADGNITTVNSK